MRKFIIELAAVAVFSGPMLAVLAAFNGKGVSWISLVPILVAVVGSVGIAVACRTASRAVRAKRIAALTLLGLFTPVLGGTAAAGAEVGAWGIAAAAAVAFAVVAFGLGRLTPLSIDEWTKIESPVSPNPSLERTREI